MVHAAPTSWGVTTWRWMVNLMPIQTACQYAADIFKTKLCDISLSKFRLRFIPGIKSTIGQNWLRYGKAPSRRQTVIWTDDNRDYWHICVTRPEWVNTLRPRQNGRHFADDTFKSIFLNENVIISIKISLKVDHKGPINNIPALVQIMAWRLPGDKPLSEPRMIRLPTHICVTRPQWTDVDW